MKKVISLFLCLGLLLCGCGTIPDETTSLSSAADADSDIPVETFLVTTASAETEVSSECITIEESVVFDNGDFKLTAKEIDFSDNYYVKVKFLAENNSDKNVVFSGSYFTINGITMYSSMYIEVSAGKKSNNFLEIRKEDLEHVGIENIATIVAQDTYIYDNDSYETILEFKFEIKTSISEGYTQTYDKSGETVYNQNGIIVKYKGIVPGQYSGEEMEFYIENSSNTAVNISIDNVSVNGFTIYGSMLAHAYPGCVCYEVADFSSSDLESNDIEMIEEVCFTLYAYDQETYETVWKSDEIIVGRESVISDVKVAPDLQIEIAEPSATEEAYEADSKPDDISLDVVVSLLEEQLSDSFENVAVSVDDSIITVNIWQTGIAEGVVMASAGDAACLEAWNEVVANQKTLCVTIIEFVETLGLTDFSVLLNVLNERNTDNVLLAIYDGSIIYNAVNE